MIQDIITALRYNFPSDSEYVAIARGKTNCQRRSRRVLTKYAQYGNRKGNKSQC